MTSAHVRRADSSDLSALLTPRTDWKGTGNKQFTARVTNWFDRDAASRWWWLAEHARIPVGMVSLKLIDPERLHDELGLPLQPLRRPGAPRPRCRRRTGE